MSTLTTTEDSPVDLLGEDQQAYANRPDHRGMTHRQSRAPGGPPAASRACLRDAAGGDSDRAAVRAAGLAVGGSPGRGDADHRERLPLAPGALQDREELLAGWAPDTPYLRSTTKNGTPLIPSARASSSSARTASA